MNIALCGKAGSGKDAVANILRKEGYQQLAIASKIKLIAVDIAYSGVSIHEKWPDLVFQGLFGERKATEEFDCIIKKAAAILSSLVVLLSELRRCSRF